MLMGCIALKDKMKGGYAVVKAMTSLMLAVFFLLASGANAQFQISLQLDLENPLRM